MATLAFHDFPAAKAEKGKGDWVDPFAQ